jgi:hypothetical protein
MNRVGFEPTHLTIREASFSVEHRKRVGNS